MEKQNVEVVERDLNETGVEVINLDPVQQPTDKWTAKDTFIVAGAVVTGGLAIYGAYCAGKNLVAVIKGAKAKKAAEVIDDLDEFTELDTDDFEEVVEEVKEVKTKKSKKAVEEA